MTEPSRAPEPLKPCPFCGELPTPYSWDSPLTGPNSEIVHCATVGCPASTHEKMERSNRAAWNRRSATPASPADVEAEMDRNIEAWSRAQDLMEQYGLTDGQILEVQLALQIPALSPSSPREPSEAVVEMMARRDYENDWPTPPHDTWEETDEETQQDYRDDARDIIVKLLAIDFPPSGGTHAD